MKYRIQQIGDQFFPQYQNIFWMWSRFIYDEGDEFGSFYNIVYFTSLEEAKNFIEKQKSDSIVQYHNVD